MWVSYAVWEGTRQAGQNLRIGRLEDNNGRREGGDWMQ
jgi:hypothetical protein